MLGQQYVALLDGTAISKLLCALAVNFWHMGQLEDALEAVFDCMVLRCDLALDQPSLVNPSLAHILNNLSIHDLELGHQEQALEFVQESVALYHNLAGNWPSTFNCGLAHSLYHFSIVLSYLDHKKEAISAVQECMTICHHVARDLSRVFKPRFAFVLYNLPAHLSNLGLLEEAWDCGVLQCNLIQDGPSSFNSALTLSLHEYSVHLSKLGHWDDALRVIQECVALRCNLAQG
jgi:tetratricopeptide (TPR) repeat protein